MKQPQGTNKRKRTDTRRAALALYDFLTFLFSVLIVFMLWPNKPSPLDVNEIVYQVLLGAVCLYSMRIVCGVYRNIWRFAVTNTYINFIKADFMAGVLYYVLGKILPFYHIPVLNKTAILTINLLIGIIIRLTYQFLYQNSSKNSRMAKIVRPLAHILTGLNIKPAEDTNDAYKNKIKIAIIGAGRVGSALAEELLSNPSSPYVPVCFVDIDHEKIGRQISGIRVLSDKQATPDTLASYSVQEIVFAIPDVSSSRKKFLYDHYKKTKCKIKTYDYPLIQSASKNKRTLREFDKEDLLFREQKKFVDEKTASYYRDKTVLVSGGGGSIGSELCRQVVKMGAKKLIVLDIYENGAYDIQQELRIAYGKDLELQVEIVSVCDRVQLEKIFEEHRPDIVLHAAAHKHVPLMERNCCEAVYNNVFGTLNIVEVSEKYEVSKFIMISTDKAVNPTNVMGATKRMCEMIVLSRSNTKTNFSATRFGNVLGSNGSVIPLFKRQIANGGPITITDKRIIRYFMTIPEASQLVLQSGAMAKNGELYVLDMGKPVKILELAENMITLTGYEPYKDIDIVETGLRPGEKLYEELLIKNEELDKTENEMIFIEREKPFEETEIDAKITLLREALATNCNQTVKEALKKAVPTFKSPLEINDNVE